MAPPYSVRTVEETGSTQDDARREYDGEPLLVVAARQRQGRGRDRSEWRTAPRALAASLAWEPEWPPRDWPLIPLLAGLAATRVTGVPLKWPNDVGDHGLKVGGILSESAGGVVVVGLGLNLWWPDAPPGVGALHRSDPGSADGERIARAWCEQLLALVRGDPAGWPRSEYVAACTTVGRMVTWEPDGAGRAAGIDEAGGLVVDIGERRIVLRAGEVRHVR